MQSQIQQKSSVEFEPYFVKSDLKNIHEKAKATAMSQFQKTRKLGGSEMIQTYVAKLESHIQVNFNKFDVENDKKKIDFDVSHDSIRPSNDMNVLIDLFNFFLCTDYGREEYSNFVWRLLEDLC